MKSIDLDQQQLAMISMIQRLRMENDTLKRDLASLKLKSEVASNHTQVNPINLKLTPQVMVSM